MDTGSKLKKLREEKNIYQDELTDILHLTPYTMVNSEDAFTEAYFNTIE